MSETQYGEPRRDAFDPIAEPEYFDGVLGRRFAAFLIDAVLICAPIGAAAVFIFVFGFLTFGFGWFLFSLLSPVLSSGRSPIPVSRSAAIARQR